MWVTTSHVANAMHKLDANTRAEAVAKAIQLGLLSEDDQKPGFS